MIMINKEDILILTYNMNPYSKQWGACQRMYYLAEKLNNYFNIKVVHYADKRNYYRFAKNSFTTFPVFINRKNKYRKFNLLSKAGRYICYHLNSLLEKIFISGPNNSASINVLRYFYKAKKIVAKLIKRNNIKNVIISAPPFALFIFIPYLKNKFTNINIIIDYRDPWNINSKNKISPKIENFLISKADKIVLFSKKYMSDFVEDYEVETSKIDYVYNGFNNDHRKSYSGKEQVRDYLLISYVGSYSFNDNSWTCINNILKAFESIVKKNLNMKLKFVGAEKVREMRYWKKKLSDNIEFLSPVDAYKAYKIMRDSHIVLVLYTWNNKRADYMLTGKFFEYISSESIIWGVGKQSANFNEMIREYKLGLTCTNKVEDIVAHLKIFYNLWKDNKLEKLRAGNNKLLTKLSRNYQNDKYFKFLI